MARRNSGRRGRPRKRRPVAQASAKSDGAGAHAAATGTIDGTARGERRASAGASRAARGGARSSRRDGGLMDLLPVGERPQPPWHPWPLSELLILVGLIGTIVGFGRGEGGHTLLFAGIGAIVLGTLEFTTREHLGGYRSHTVLLAFVPTVVVHTLVALALFSLGASATAAVAVPLIIDLPVFALLFRLLRTRFLDARRERTSTL